jgi:uncharacterized membrane protein
LSTLLHATVYVFLHNLLNVLVQIANKIGLRKNISNECFIFKVNEHECLKEYRMKMTAYEKYEFNGIIIHISIPLFT